MNRTGKSSRHLLVCRCIYYICSACSSRKKNWRWQQ